jgi:hypothetical protein
MVVVMVVVVAVLATAGMNIVSADCTGSFISGETGSIIDRFCGTRRGETIGGVGWEKGMVGDGVDDSGVPQLGGGKR